MQCFWVGLLHQRLHGRGPHALKHGVHALHCGHGFGVNAINVVVQREQRAAGLRVVERRANHALHFRFGCCGWILQRRVHNIHRQFFVGFDGHGEVAVAAAGFNVKTHDFVGHAGFLVGLRGDVLVPHTVFVAARGLLVGFNGGAFDFDPARRTDVLDVAVAQQGGNVGFVKLGALVATVIQTHF